MCLKITWWEIGCDELQKKKTEEEAMGTQETGGIRKAANMEKVRKKEALFCQKEA